MSALGGDLIADAPDFLKDFVFHSFNYIMSSCGVHMTGAGKPSASQISRNFSTMVALAICRQFHVSRNSIPCTAAVATCAASVSALAGINRLDINTRVKSSASLGYGNTRHSLNLATRSSAALASPRSTSFITRTETNNSYRFLRSFHQSLVVCCCPAIDTSLLGQAVNKLGIVVSR